MSAFKRADPAHGSVIWRSASLGSVVLGRVVLGSVVLAICCSDNDRKVVPATSEPTFDLDGQTWQIKAVAKDETETCGRTFTEVFEISQDGGDITYVRLLGDGAPSGDSLAGTAFSETNKFPEIDPFEGGLVFPGLDRIVDLAGSLDVEIIDPEGNSQAVRITITDSAQVVDESLGVMDGNFELTIEGCQGQWQVFSKRLPDEDE